MGYNLFSEHGDTVGVGFARPKNTELLIKNVRETTDLGKGMALCVFVSLCSNERDATKFSDCPVYGRTECFSALFVSYRK